MSDDLAGRQNKIIDFLEEMIGEINTGFDEADWSYVGHILDEVGPLVDEEYEDWTKRKFGE